jgi:PAS domain S-box-containing protein
VKRLKKWLLRPGRAVRLQFFLAFLIGATLAFVLNTLIQLNITYQNTGSLEAVWREEWRSGRAITSIIWSGPFHLFLLALGWSAFMRLRAGEMGNIRLRRSEAKYRSIINHAGEAIFLLDDRGRVLEWNKAAEELFGLYRRHALNRAIADLDLGLERDLDQALADLQRGGRSLNYETRRQDKGGHVAQISLTLSTFRSDGGDKLANAGSFVVIARDITSEKQLESRMSETEKLVGIGQLAAGIAHQLNTPLGSILLSAQMLDDVVEDEDASEDVRRIIRQTEQCRGIIKGLLNFARPTGSERDRMNLEDAITETAFLMEKKLKVAGVALKVEARTEPWIFGNRNEVEQVFFNLLANALDALPAGGNITVTIEDAGAGEIMVVFRDDGEGIPATNHDRIFLPFFTTKDYGKGTGLGLSIVARIVHEHGGRIELESEGGTGTVFRLWFPRARNGKKKTSLLVDDTAPGGEASND